MRTHIFSTITLGLSILTSMANAAPMGFYPGQEWIISQDQKTCEISNIFNNGYALTLSHDAKNQSAFAIDFKQNAFSTGQSQTVQIQTPGSEASQINATAINPTTLQGNVQNEKQLIESLGSTETLDINVGGNAFRFHLSGLRASLKDYGNCVASLTKPAAPQAPAIDPVIKTAAPPEVINEPPSGEIEIEKPIEPIATQSIKTTETKSANLKPITMDDYVPNPDIKVTIDKPAQIVPPALTPEPPEFTKTQDDFSQETIQKAEEISSIHKMEQTHEKMIAPTIDQPVNAFVKKSVGTGYADFTKLEHNDMSNAEMDTMRETIERLRAENIQLESELQHEQSLSGLPQNMGDWDLEKATLRFQEAERQLKAMGQRLAKERLRHETEKKELEALLFDPSVTTKEQLAKLAELEYQLEQKSLELEKLKAQMTQ